MPFISPFLLAAQEDKQGILHFQGKGISGDDLLRRFLLLFFDVSESVSLAFNVVLRCKLRGLEKSVRRAVMALLTCYFLKQIHVRVHMQHAG